MEVTNHHKQANSELVSRICIKSNNVDFRNPKMKNPKNGKNLSWKTL